MRTLLLLWALCAAHAAPPPSLDEYARRLGSADIAERAEAAQRLAKAGAAALPALQAALKHPDAYARMRAADILGGLGAEAKPAVPALTEALKDRNRLVQKRAARALDRVSPPENTPATQVRATLRAQGAVRTLPGDAVPALLKALEDESESVRIGAAKALGEIRPVDPRALVPLVRALEKGGPELRLHAVRALGGMGPEADRASAVLAAALRDPEQPVRASAAQALEAVGPPAAGRAGQALILALSDEDWLVRALAARALSVVDPKAGTDAVARIKRALIADLKNDDEGIRYYAVSGLGAMGPAALDAAPYLVAAIDDEKPSVRRAAAEALLQADARSLPVLISVWRRSPDENLRTRIGDAMIEAGEASAPALAEALRAGSRQACLEALDLLTRLGPKAAAAAPTLARLLHPEGQREFAFYKEKALDTASPLAVSHRSLSIRNDDIRFRTLHALEAMGPSAAAAAGPIVRALAKDPNRTIRHKAERVLAALGAPPVTDKAAPAKGSTPRPRSPAQARRARPRAR